jgi:prepilin-type N-terminal cleavage/methylation domain-containing protein
MTWQVEMRAQRNPTSGFTLLETLVALTIAALCVTTVLLVSIQLQTREADTLRRARLTEFALGVLDIYRVLGPKMGLDGARPGGWVWSLKERPYTEGVEAARAYRIVYLEVDATVFNREAPDLRVSLSEVVARRQSDVAP